MVEEIEASNQEKENLIPSENASEATAETVSDKPAVANEEETKQTEAKNELLCFGSGLNSGGLQANFNGFRKAKVEEVKYRNYMAA